ncbi:TIGR03756 family integrating conjugative element protein [Erwinia pyrifoliae]|uniref:TIGR03756 family integrating conjugative element protein n=1 Tax=Erwinia pyrifoliae TaxID=79967 RepID=UPI00223AB290|nr:TIGR03756 family integrating conjugative element protein [Erwinia pyrifoliae]MCT2387512.1 TIGR03756 family integrating conjugative element protein [Erwinia pyrifoliae]MCU8588340.1 TIGR03756 family integrating conjugative element protein [Erwinia pyrifoliae]
MNITFSRPRRVALATIMACSGTLASVNTAGLLASAASPDCISWRVSGICYWLMCTPLGCSVKTSVKVTHFIPQAVVSAWLSPGDNPWTEMSALSATTDGAESVLLGGAAGVATGGGRQEMKAPGMRSQNLHFYYAGAYGHPATKIIGGRVPGYSCDSAATPFIPYFVSALDALAWRTGVPESVYPEALIPGQREVGSTPSGNMWGNVYPRSGFVTQTDGYKSAAVVVQRVADIITRQGQLHVYNPLVGQRSAGYWPPGAVSENSGTKNHKWQRLSPRLSQSCAVFPDVGGQIAQNGNYAWALWQPYSCCKRRGQTFLYSTDFS